MRIVLSTNKVSIRDGDIILGRETVGRIWYNESRATRRSLLQEFADSPKQNQLLEKLQLPSRFTRVAVQRLRVDGEYRGKGIATAVFNSFKKPTLIHLEISGIPGAGMKQATRISVYEKMGFKTVKEHGRLYGWLLLT